VTRRRLHKNEPPRQDDYLPDCLQSPREQAVLIEKSLFLRRISFTLLSQDQIGVTNHAVVVCLSMAPALCNFFPQIRQPHSCGVLSNSKA
jgi:hypothetical protein